MLISTVGELLETVAKVARLLWIIKTIFIGDVNV